MNISFTICFFFYLNIFSDSPCYGSPNQKSQNKIERPEPRNNCERTFDAIDSVFVKSARPVQHGFLKMWEVIKMVSNKGISETLDKNEALRMLQHAGELSPHRKNHVCRAYYDAYRKRVYTDFNNSEKACYKSLEHIYNKNKNRVILDRVNPSKCYDKVLKERNMKTGEWKMVKLVYVAMCSCTINIGGEEDTYFVGSTPRRNYYYIYEQIKEGSLQNVQLTAVLKLEVTEDKEYEELLRLIQMRNYPRWVRMTPTPQE